MSLMSLLTDFRHKKLTYRGWVPYNYSSYITFCFTYTQQILSTFHGAVINVACDTLLCGLLMHICCQIEILEYRLKKILNNQFSLDYCIRHHNRIFELVIILTVENYIFISFSIAFMCELFCKNYDKSNILYLLLFSLIYFLFLPPIYLGKERKL